MSTEEEKAQRFIFQKVRCSRKLQKTQTTFMIYSLTRNPNCCTFTKIISHFVSRHLRNFLAVYFKISLSPTKLINSSFVPHLFSVVRTRRGNRPFSKVNGSTWFGFLLARQQHCPSRIDWKQFPCQENLPVLFMDFRELWQTARIPRVVNCQNIVCYLKLSIDLGRHWNRHNPVVVGYTKSAFQLILWRLT